MVVDLKKLLTIAIQIHWQLFITQSLENKELKLLSVCRIFYWLSALLKGRCYQNLYQLYRVFIKS